MRLKELVEFQWKYHCLEATTMTRKSLCDLIVPFSDKYSLKDGQALRIARREFSRREIEKLMKNQKQTNADKIRAMSDEELAVWLCNKFDDCSPSTCPGANYCNGTDGKANGLVKWLKQPVEE